MVNTDFGPSDQPLAVDGVETAVFEGEAVLFSEVTMMLHRLGPLAGAVWLLCDGETSITDMVGELAELFDTDHAELSAAVPEVLVGLAAAGLLVGHEPPVPVTPAVGTSLAADGTPILLPPPNP